MPKGIPKSKQLTEATDKADTQSQDTQSQYIVIKSLCDKDVEVSAVDVKADYNKAGVILKMKTKNDIKVSFIADVRIAKDKQGEIVLQTV